MPRVDSNALGPWLAAAGEEPSPSLGPDAASQRADCVASPSTARALLRSSSARPASVSCSSRRGDADSAGVGSGDAPALPPA